MCDWQSVVMSNNDPGTTSERLDRYITSSEEVAMVSRGSNRTFAVTDSRVVDISEGKTAQGRPTEIVESTIFNNVAKVDLSVKDTITVVDDMRRGLGVLSAIIGLLLFFAGVILDSGDISGVLFLIGIVLIAVGVWLWISATETSPGGIQIELYHNTPREESKAVYTLPEDQKGTARAVVRMAGKTNCTNDLSLRSKNQD
jgi:hypothetical protein